MRTKYELQELVDTQIFYLLMVDKAIKGKLPQIEGEGAEIITGDIGDTFKKMGFVNPPFIPCRKLFLTTGNKIRRQDLENIDRFFDYYGYYSNSLYETTAKSLADFHPHDTPPDSLCKDAPLRFMNVCKEYIPVDISNKLPKYRYTPAKTSIVIDTTSQMRFPMEVMSLRLAKGGYVITECKYTEGPKKRGPCFC